MRDTVLAAITRTFDNNAGLKERFASSSGLWVIEVPESDSLPFAVLFHDGETPDFTNGGDDYIETGAVHFDVFAVNLETTEELANAIVDAFDPTTETVGWKKLQVTGNRTKSMEMSRTGYKIEQVPFRDKNNNVVFQSTVSYQTRMKHTKING